MKYNIIRRCRKLKTMVSIASISQLFKRKSYMGDEFNQLIENDTNHLSDLVQDLSQDEYQYEIIFIVPSKHIGDAISLKLHELGKNNLYQIPIKFVHSKKASKRYTLLNLSWQAASGDQIVFHENLKTLKSNVNYIIKQYNSSSFDVLMLEDQNVTSSLFKSKNRYKLYKRFSEMHDSSYHRAMQVSQENGKSVIAEHHYIPRHCIPYHSRGFVINRKVINDAFQSQKEQYEPYLAIGKLPVEKDVLLIHNNKEDQSPIVEYQKSYYNELLLMYTNTRSEASKLTAYLAPIIAIALGMCLLVVNNYIQELAGMLQAKQMVTYQSINHITSSEAFILTVASVCFLVGLFSGISLIASAIKEHQILQRQILAASLNKSVVGQFEIEVFMA